MMAAINVQAANMPPTIAITNPPNGSVLASPATFSIGAKASDTDGGVTNVLFLQGTASLGNIQNSPYLVTVHNLQVGDYTFAAVASDNGGLKATNAITVHVVAPALPVGQFPFEILVDGQRLAEQTVEKDGTAPHFFDVEYTMPIKLVKDKQKVTVRFQSTKEMKSRPCSAFARSVLMRSGKGFEQS
jgi:hypothetical protein